MDPSTSRREADTTGFGRPVDERARLADRRAKLGLPTSDQSATGIAALSLSGGGIRSATFSFGVIQALATSESPSSPALDDTPATTPRRPLLAAFDYLSTVSGGGYIGGFLCSLFVPGRLRAGSSSKQAAADAFDTCAYVPPERLRAGDTLKPDSIGKCPTAWLRENGRYLTPTGAGDTLYAVATALRNWLAIQYVLGTLFLAAFSLLALLRATYAFFSPWYRRHIEISALQLATSFWWSPVWYLVAAVIVLWLAPSGIAFWLAYPKRNQSDAEKPPLFDPSVWATVCVALLLLLPLAIGLTTKNPNAWDPIYLVPAAVSVTAVLALCMHLLLVGQSASITDLRVRLTQVGARGIGWCLGVAVIAATDTLGQSIYLAICGGMSALRPLTPAAILAAIVWTVRKLAALTDEKSGSTSLLKRLPLNWISALVGIVMLLMIGSLWNTLVEFFDWQGKMPRFFDWEGTIPTTPRMVEHQHIEILSVLFSFAIFMAWTAGRFSGFVNLSTFQAVYGARLTRAYLGASNGNRFTPDSRGRRNAGRSVAEPMRSDHLTLTEYYDESVLAPLHIINITVNQTVDPAEQLVQRDRKGRPLAILPTGFTVDGALYRFREVRGQLTLGQWIGISGAAFTTGLGRATSVGTSLALGLANVRLGMWWESGHGVDKSRGLERLFKGVFRVQTFLLYELLARFHGLRREWQYLSDGGHFENTGCYELVRPGRGVRLVVLCDNGCDPEYRFADIANLIRLARIDFQLEVEVDRGVTTHPLLGKVFGDIGDFRQQDSRDDRCAILLRVFPAAAGRAVAKPVAHIIALKPRVIASASIDILEYQSTHSDFPQQTTANQFFDEAQWESYRDLGYRIGRRVFGGAAEGGCGPALWSYLAEQR